MVTKKDLLQYISQLEIRANEQGNTIDRMGRAINMLNEFVDNVALTNYNTVMVDNPGGKEPVKAVLVRDYFIKPEAILPVMEEAPKKKTAKKKTTKK